MECLLLLQSLRIIPVLRGTSEVVCCLLQIWLTICGLLGSETSPLEAMCREDVEARCLLKLWLLRR